MMTRKNLIRCLASSSLNPYRKIKSVTVRNGGLQAVSAYFFSNGTETAETSSPFMDGLEAFSRTLQKIGDEDRNGYMRPNPRVPISQPDALWQRLHSVTDPTSPNYRVPLSQVLKKWVDEGREVHQNDVRGSIRHFRKLRRYNDAALEISEWFGSIDKSNFTTGSAAIHLDLIYKVHGLVQAKRYFESIPNDSKFPHLYGALLNCYVQEKLLDEAEAIMQKMREQGYDGTLSYSDMLRIYSQMGNQIKMKDLVQEMESKDIKFDKVTYNILLSAYASTSDIEEMEKLLMKKEADPFAVMDWISYSISANGYLKVGDIAKATSMLQKCEEIIKDGERRDPKVRDLDHAYGVLMAQYASIGRKDEVYRMWKLHKKPRKFLNRGYACMISSLLKLDDTTGAQKELDDWLSIKVDFDIRIPDLLVSAFCKKGQVEQAEAIVNNLLERGQKPMASTWHHMASGYCKTNQMEDAVKMTKKGLSETPLWRPEISVLASCFEYLKKNGKNDEVEEIIGLIKCGDKSPADLRDLITRYI